MPKHTPTKNELASNIVREAHRLAEELVNFALDGGERPSRRARRAVYASYVGGVLDEIGYFIHNGDFEDVHYQIETLSEVHTILELGK